MTATQQIADVAVTPPNRRAGRLALVLAVIAAAAWPGGFGAATRGLLSDAFLGVSVFVAMTLLAVYGVEHVFRINTAQWLSARRRLQLPIAAFLGMLPGCAGAVMVTAAYAGGSVSLGTMVAALTATMGDAAFLLIATRPEAAAVLMPTAFVAGIVTGYLVDRFAPGDDMSARSPSCALAQPIGRVRPRDMLFLALALPGLAIGTMDAFLIEQAPLVAQLSPLLAVGGTLLAMLVWATSPVQALTVASDPAITRMTEETSFITFWVVVAFLSYGWFEYATGFDLGALFAVIAPVVPLIAILIGFIPGCGPQVLVTTLYLNGAIPFSALIGNAISNDGDALFPAIALSPRAALLATIYTTLPALVVAYGFYFLAPGFMD